MFDLENQFVIGVTYNSSPKIYEYELSSENMTEMLLELSSNDLAINHIFNLKRKTLAIVDYKGQIADVTAEYLRTNPLSTKATKTIKFARDTFLLTLDHLTDKSYEGLRELYDKGQKKVETINVSPPNFLKKVEETNNNKKGDKKIMKNNLFGDLGQKVNNVFGISMFDGSVAYRLGGKFVTISDGVLTDVSEFVMDIDIPGIIMPSAVSELKENDLIKVQGEFGLVLSVEGNSVKVIKGDGTVIEITGVKNPMLGGSFVPKVMNPMGGFAGQGQTGGGLGNINPMMFMLMGDGKGFGSDDTFKNLMMMQMFSQGGGLFPQTPNKD